MTRKSIALLISTSMLSACYSFRGPEPVLDRGNVVHADVSGPRTGYLYERFRRATLNASGCRDEGEPAQRIAQTEPLAEICNPMEFRDEAAQKAAMEDFMRAGYALIYSDCAAYFAHMGRNQGRSRLARDAIAPIGSLITGIISIVRFENSNTRDDLLASLALFTTAGTSALDVYDQHFLFGADNIDAVRQLIQRALAAHAAATFTAAHATFGQAANHLDDNQAICRPSHILTLVRQAIAAGEIEARSSNRPAQQEEEAGDNADQNALSNEAEPAIESISVSVPQ